MARRPCSEPGCPTLISGATRCIEHARQRDKARGTKAERGYGPEHLVERAKWVRIINETGWPCGRCEGHIQPGQPFHLDHSDDRTGYIGPSHPHCNMSAAGRASHGLAPK